MEMKIVIIVHLSLCHLCDRVRVQVCFAAGVWILSREDNLNKI